jgi:hypothetical protein
MDIVLLKICSKYAHLKLLIRNNTYAQFLTEQNIRASKNKLSKKAISNL